MKDQANLSLGIGLQVLSDAAVLKRQAREIEELKKRLGAANR